MPIYEYHCIDCKHVWDLTEHIDEHNKPHAIHCPKCGSERVEQVMSDFFAKTGRKS